MADTDEVFNGAIPKPYASHLVPLRANTVRRESGTVPGIAIFGLQNQRMQPLKQTFLEPTDKSVAELFSRGISGPITMLNLLRLRDIADYSAYPDLAPQTPISGRAAYARYMEHTLPYLIETGGELLYVGEGADYLIGPEGQGWDLAMLVKQSSLQDFLAFATNEGYLKGLGHRSAAVWDSRILPLVDIDLAPRKLSI